MLQAGQDLLQLLARRVCLARVAEVRAVVQTVPDEGGTRMDRRHDRAGLWVRFLVLMDQPGIEIPAGVAALRSLSLIGPPYLSK